MVAALMVVSATVQMDVRRTNLSGLWLPRIRLLIIARGSHAQSQRILPPSPDNITHGGAGGGRETRLVQGESGNGLPRDFTVTRGKKKERGSLIKLVQT